jgi:glycopeptide antibiotics resistance protein
MRTATSKICAVGENFLNAKGARMQRLRITTLVFLYVGYVLIVTLYPFEPSADVADSLGQFISGFFTLIREGWKQLASKDFLVNICFFIPCGVLLYCALESSEHPKTLKICLATLCGACISFIIELCQVFVSRYPSAFDVLSNTIGTGCGAVLSALWPRPVAVLADSFWEKAERSRIALCLVVLYGALPFILSVSQSLAPFRIWDSRFSFQIGNEATLDKPWLGKIYLVALYNRALPEDEVSKNFYQGFASAASKKRASEGLIALYTFSERRGDIVHDMSGFKKPLDLIILPQDRVRWLESSDGIEILQPAILRSQQPGTKLVSAVSANGELSIEVWLTPDNTVQDGAARIVSLSADRTTRNFTLGQAGANIEFRVRTPVSITNRSPLVLGSENAFSTLERSHIVATYKDGVERLYLNGKRQSEILDLTREGIVGFGTRKTAVAQLVYSFFYFFPVSFFLALFFSTRSAAPTYSLVLSFAIAIGLLMVAEFFQAFAFDRAIDIQLIAYGTMTAALGALSGRAFATKAAVFNVSCKLSAVG